MALVLMTVIGLSGVAFMGCCFLALCREGTPKPKETRVVVEVLTTQRETSENARGSRSVIVIPEREWAALAAKYHPAPHA